MSVLYFHISLLLFKSIFLPSRGLRRLVYRSLTLRWLSGYWGICIIVRLLHRLSCECCRCLCYFLVCARCESKYS